MARKLMPDKKVVMKMITEMASTSKQDLGGTGFTVNADEIEIEE